tara:strand:- start:69 stop:317 length:249 start_codon:yes stop_codon:yes gene_type:complete
MCVVSGAPDLTVLDAHECIDANISLTEMSIQPELRNTRAKKRITSQWQLLFFITGQRAQKNTHHNDDFFFLTELQTGKDNET